MALFHTTSADFFFDVSWCCIEKYHNFERNEDRAIVFLKWLLSKLNATQNSYKKGKKYMNSEMSSCPLFWKNSSLHNLYKITLAVALCWFEGQRVEEVNECAAVCSHCQSNPKKSQDMWWRLCAVVKNEVPRIIQFHP